MRTIIIILCLLSPALNAVSQKLAEAKAAAAPSASAAFQWSETTYDFVKTTVGIPVSFEFRFKNTGMSPLVISSAKATCGCTVTAYTKEPILHGAMGFVKATYDAAKTGVYSKTVTVTANTPEGVVQLTVKGEIIGK
jgi:hypothetical protein